jgi:hypothetical protein
MVGGTQNFLLSAPSSSRPKNDYLAGLMMGSSLHMGAPFGGTSGGDKYQHGGNQSQTLPAFVTQAASVNPQSNKNPSQIIRSVRLSQIEAESKRLVLAFESRMTNEINWALNTLAIFSCNTSQNFTLENQPYLLESLANYLVYCIQNIDSLAYTDPFEKRNKVIHVNVPSYVDAYDPSVA